MSNQDLQVVPMQEVQMRGMLLGFAQYLQDAVHAHDLRRQVTALQDEVQSLLRQIADLRVEVTLEREAGWKASNQRSEAETENSRLHAELADIQHCVDTAYGIFRSRKSA